MTQIAPEKMVLLANLHRFLISVGRFYPIVYALHETQLLPVLYTNNLRIKI